MKETFISGNNTLSDPPHSLITSLRFWIEPTSVIYLLLNGWRLHRRNPSSQVAKQRLMNTDHFKFGNNEAHCVCLAAANLLWHTPSLSSQFSTAASCLLPTISPAER
jgi:hypothetical protein